MKQSLRLLIIICAAILPLMCAGCGENEVAQNEKPVIKHEKQEEIKQEKKIENSKITKEEKNEIEKLLRDPHYVYKTTVESIKEAEKINKFEVIMCQHRSLTGFYNQLFNDFKSGNNIEIIKPVVQTDNFKNEKMQVYFKNCPGLRKQVIRTKINVPPNDLIAKSNFKLFDIDFDNDINNGKQQLFYSGAYFGEWVLEDKTSGHDIYRVLDLDKCQDLSIKSIFTPIYYTTMEATGNYSGVFKYKDKFYIYDAEDYVYKKVAPVYSITFYSWSNEKNENKTTNIDLTCKYSRDTSFKNKEKK